VTKASDQIDDSGWFYVLHEVFKGLDVLSVPLQLVQTWFYLRYAEMSGYGLSLERDVTGAKLQQDRNYMYDISERGLRPSEQGDITADHIKFMRLVAVKPLLTVAQIG